MRIGCTGPNGRVGRLLVKRGVVPLSCDVTKPEQVAAAFDSESPQVVIHLAAKSDVDYCEQPQNWDEVRHVNFNGAMNVANEAQTRRIPMVLISSEHVFPGHSFWNWPYKESDRITKPGLNNYALTKIAAEGLRPAFPVMKVVRTSYLFDWVRLMTEELSHVGAYQYPTFIHRSYLYLPHFVQNLLTYARRIEDMPPILHLAGSETVSQYQLMRDFVRYFHVHHVEIHRRIREWPTGDNLPVRARRPLHAGLDVQLSRSLGFPTFSYKDGFKQMAEDYVRG